MKELPRARLLAIDPTRQGFGYVLLESQILIDWGLVHAGGSVDASVRRLYDLIRRYKPSTLIIEDYLQRASRRSHRAREFLVTVELLVLSRKVTIARVSDHAVREAFPESMTKHDIALVLADRFPELRTWRPRLRKAWMSEDERMNIFDALALAEAFIASTDNYQPQQDLNHE